MYVYYSQVDIVLHEAHARVTRPALFVVVADDILVVRVGVLGEVALDKVTCLLRREAEEDVNAVDVARVESDRVRRLSGHILGKQTRARSCITVRLVSFYVLLAYYPNIS